MALSVSEGIGRQVDYWWTVHKRTWRGGIVSSFGSPLLYVLGMGVLLGGFIEGDPARLEGATSYLAFVVPGLVAAHAMQLAVGETTYPVMSGIKWHKTYHAQLATPLTPRDIVNAHLLFVLARVASACAVFMLVLAPFGVFESWWGPFLAWGAQVLVGMAFAAGVFAVSARMAERFGVEVQAMHTDDGLVFRLLETEGDDDTLTNALIEAIVLDPDDVADIVTHQVGGTPLFAARFRECAARALLLPRGNPGRRQALWQQRQRAAQLLEVASAYPSFPIVLEAVREVLQDVYDVPGLVNLMRSIAKREVRVVHTQTTSPSPYASHAVEGSPSRPARPVSW